MKKGLEAFEIYLHSQGLKFTSQRRMVAEKLLSIHGHLAAEEILKLLNKDRPLVSKATLYRTLFLMKKSGYFDEHDFGVGKKYYEYMVGRDHHDHLYCIECGVVIEFKVDEIEHLQNMVTQKYQFTPLYHSHKIFGYCERCSKKQGGHKSVLES